MQSRQERFQEQNRKIALELLRGELWEKEQAKKDSVLSAQRLAIGRSMRSEKIRTYNFPQNRVTDHRLNKSWHNLDKITEGRLDEMILAMAGLEFGYQNPQGGDASSNPENGGN